MKDYIQDWLGSRLGLVVDLSPEHFGRLAKDGRLLGKLLYTYGIVPLQILNSIKPSKHVTDCYNNLKILKPWLEYVEVPIKDETLYEIASGQGTASFNLVCALFLSLQHKDRFHYLCAAKERKYSHDKDKRYIKVERVPEQSVMGYQSNSEPDLAVPLIKKDYLVNRHKEKCSEIVEKMKFLKNNFTKSDGKTEFGPLGHSSSKKLTKVQSPMEKTDNEINMFSEKFVPPLPDLTYQELIDLQNQVASLSLKPVPNFKEAKLYMNFIKEKTRKGIITQTFQEEMQTLVFDELWNNIKNKQEYKFEEIVCKNLLKQSQYEKQMCTKLALLRRQKDILLKNRQNIERLSRKQLIQKEYEDSVNYYVEVIAENEFDEEFERQRLLELHKRMYIKKVELKFKERLEEATSILDKLIDIAVRISEFREVFACEIPKHFMKDLKELFYKDLPIFDIVEEVEELYKSPTCGGSAYKEEEDCRDELLDYGEGEENDFVEGESEETFEMQDKDECGKTGEYDVSKAAEFIRQEVLNECDFNDYLFLLGPWTVETLIPDESATEGSQIVLGYIVHKILAGKYPLVSVPLPTEIKPMSIRSVVQGSSDESAFNMLKELLALQNILVVRVDDAINFVLRAYKNELSAVRDIDITFQQATKSALKGKGGTERTTEQSKKDQLLKKESVTQKKLSLQEPFNKEVSTQTPRKIPDDDPLLSPNAEIGKVVFESLGIGDPVPDSAVTSAVIAYVASVQDEYDGWVLWNYPVLYSQASKLESALTGYKLMTMNEEMNTAEEIEGFGCRSNCQNPYDQDDFSEKRISRLVPKPEENTIPEKAESYFTSFVAMRKKTGELNKNDMYIKSRWQDSMIKFYIEQEIFYSVEYTSITFQTVKDIGKAIMGEGNRSTENGVELVPKSSLEVFGEGVLELNEKYNPSKKKGEKDLKKQGEIPKALKIEQETPIQAQDVEEVVDKEGIISGKSEGVEGISGSIKRDPKPGDSDWEWACGDQSEEIQLMLASFWENLEAVYIEDFKYIFFCLRAHRSNVIKYQAFLKKALKEFLKREDTKQNILNDFQHKFNDIDDDLRPDSDVKSELHVRVSELEEVLLNIADERRKSSESYRIKFINDNWVGDEMSSLVNLYIRALQLEADRCIDTCQFINDYYLSLQQKLPHENVLQKIYAPTLHVKHRSYSRLSSISRSLPLNNPPFSRIAFAKPSRGSFQRRTKHEKTRSTASRTGCCSFQHETVSLPGGSDAINEIFVSLSYPENNTSPFHKFFLDTGEDLKNNVREIAESCLAEAMKGGASTGGAGTGKEKKTAELKSEVNGHLRAEWIAALEAEINRFLYRMRIIQARGIADFNDLVLAVLNTLISLTEDIGEIYSREVESISECCKVIRCAIEEEIALQPRLELTVDEFAINYDVLLFSSSSVELTTVSSASSTKLQFNVQQLTFIFKKLLYIAPDGEIVRRAFLYILQDLRVMKSEDGIPRLLPDIWDDINPNDLPYVFDKLYQRIEIVNWKDFIIYALELPMPTDVDILNMRSSFHSYDQSNTELICLRDFMSVDFWFECHDTRFDSYKLKQFLFKMYQVDEEYTSYTSLLFAFCKDEDPFLGFIKALALLTGKRILFDDYGDFVSEEGEQDVEEEEDDFTLGSESVETRSKENEKCKKEVGYRCECKDTSGFPSGSETAEEAGESYGLYLYSKDHLKESLYTSVISHDVIRKILLIAYPSFPQLSVLLNCTKTFEVSIDNMLEGLNKDGSGMKVSGLLKHKFISRILTSTNKFKAVDLQNILKSIVEEKQGNLTNNCSLNWS